MKKRSWLPVILLIIATSITVGITYNRFAFNHYLQGSIAAGCFASLFVATWKVFNKTFNKWKHYQEVDCYGLTRLPQKKV